MTIYLFSRASTKQAPEMILIHLPVKARGQGICFSWTQGQSVHKNVQPKPSTVKTTDPALGFEFPELKSEDIDTTTKYKEEIITGKNRISSTSVYKSTTEQPTTTEDDYYDPDDPLYTPPTTDVVDFSIHEVEVQDQPVNDEKSHAKFYHKKTKTASKHRKITYNIGSKSVSTETQSGDSDNTFQGCWAVDQVVIVNTAHVPSELDDSFHPVNPSNWLSFPGAYFKVICLSLR